MARFLFKKPKNTWLDDITSETYEIQDHYTIFKISDIWMNSEEIKDAIRTDGGDDEIKYQLDYNFVDIPETYTISKKS